MDISTIQSDPAALAADGALTIPAAVAFSGLSRSTLYELMAAGELRYLHEGRRRLIPRRALVQHLARRLRDGAELHDEQMRAAAR